MVDSGPRSGREVVAPRGRWYRRWRVTGGSYTPGDSRNAIDFIAARSLTSHGAFFLPHLAPGASVLDSGCDPGTITLGITERVAPGCERS